MSLVAPASMMVVGCTSGAYCFKAGDSLFRKIDLDRARKTALPKYWKKMVEAVPIAISSPDKMYWRAIAGCIQFLGVGGIEERKSRKTKGTYHLYDEATADAHEDLVAYPLDFGRRGDEGSHEARPNGGEDVACQGPGWDVA